MGGRVFCGGGWALNPQGFVEAALGVEILHAGQLTPGDLLSSADNPPQRLAVSVRATAVPGCEAAGQEALYCASVEVPDGVGSQAEFLQAPKPVQALLGLFDDCSGVAVPGQVLFYGHPEVFKSVHPLDH